MNRIHLILPLLVTASLALSCLEGCSKGQAQTVAKTPKTTVAGSTNPEERLDEERMEEAFRGLQLSEGLITVANASPRSPSSGENLRLKAEAVTEGRNAWFVSVAAFRDAILADPNNAKSYEGLARSMLLEGKTDYAEPALATALKLDPRFSKARYELGMVKQMDSDYAGAVAEWKTVTKIDPGYSDVYARMAVASYYQKDYASAWTYLDQADKRHQNVPGQFRPLLKEADPRP